jgi:hypothetical protein
MVALVTKHLLVRGTSVLVPATARDLGILVRQHRNVPLNTILRGPHRSRKQENWYRKLVRVCADGIGIPPETLHVQLKEKGGKIVLKSCADMDDAEFQAYVAGAVETIFAEFLVGVRRQDVYDEVDRLLDCGW